MREIIASRRFRIAAAVALAAAAVGGSARSSAAAPEAVVPCSVSSLISAIATANTTPADSSITLTSGCVYTLTAPDNTTDGGTGLPVITGQVSVAGSATIARSAVAGTAAFRIFDVGPGGSLTLNSVTLSNGLANDAVNGGGAIFSHGSLTVTASTFSGNSSPAPMGTSGGAIDSSGPLTVSLSTFTGNTAQEGGAIFNQSTTGAATVTDSTFAGNTATIFGGGALVSAQGTTNLARDTFSQNSAPGGGAIDNDATVNVTDSTFTGNTAGTSGGGAVQNFGTATISWSTLSGNGSPYGANLHNFTTASPVTVRDSIVANGLGGGTNCTGSPAVVDGGYNIDDGVSCGFSTANQSETNLNPDLGALASNGGPTQTMALPSNSPAVDAVPVTVPGCAGSTDQRGESRPQGPACDIGAYELLEAPVTSPTSTSLSLSAPAATYGREQAEKLSATVNSKTGTPTGSVTVTSGTTTICTMALVSGAGACTLAATRFPPGSIKLTASYGGSTIFAASASPVRTLTVAKAASRTTLSLLPATAAYGKEQAALLSVAVTPQYGGTPGGKVTIKTGATTLCSITLASGKGSCRLTPARLAAGTWHLSASYVGNSGYLASASAAKTLSVAKASSRTTLALSAGKVTYGKEQAERLTVTVTPQYGGIPGGKVTIKTGATTLCTITLASGKGSCTLASTKLRPGAYALTAAYAGSSDFTSSSSARKTLTVAR